jgi:GAF domain-containing protein
LTRFVDWTADWIRFAACGFFPAPVFDRAGLDGGRMFQPEVIQADSKAEFYRDLAAQVTALLGDERDRIANAANLSAYLYMTLPAVNWVGFYFLQGDELVVGPFQGKPACVRIALGDGVCGTAAKRCQSVLVPDVHAFPGHIACDTASRSELVIPLIKNGALFGVLDLDSPDLARFDAEDQTGLERIAAIYVAAVEGV